MIVLLHTTPVVKRCFTQVQGDIGIEAKLSREPRAMGNTPSIGTTFSATCQVRHDEAQDHQSNAMHVKEWLASLDYWDKVTANDCY